MKKYLPALILAIGAALRIMGTGSAALWFDESNTLYRTTIPFMTLFTEHSERSGDLLLELILRPLMLISHSVWMLRLPAMLAGLACLWMVWKLMRRLEFTLPQQVMTSLVVAFLPGLLWMAQDARSYSLLSLLFLAAIWFALDASWVGLLATCGLMIYTHSTGPVLAAAALLIALYLHPKEWRLFISTCFFIALSWIPAIIRMFDYPIIQQPWQPILTSNWLLYSVVTAFFPEPLSTPVLIFMFSFWILAAVGLFIGLIIFYFRAFLHWFVFGKKFVAGKIVLFMAWIIPLFLLILFCLMVQENVIQYRTLMPLLIPFALWIGWVIGKEKLPAYFAQGLIASLLIIGLMNWNPAYRGGGLDQVADQIRSQWRTGDTLVYTTVTVGLPFDYYLNDLPHRWSNIVSDPYFLGIPSIQRTSLIIPVKHSTREWVIIPQEVKLITPAEQAQLNELVNYQQPVWTINYVQAAPIKVYLVNEP